MPSLFAWIPQLVGRLRRPRKVAATAAGPVRIPTGGGSRHRPDGVPPLAWLERAVQNRKDAGGRTQDLRDLVAAVRAEQEGRQPKYEAAWDGPNGWMVIKPSGRTDA